MLVPIRNTICYTFAKIYRQSIKSFLFSFIRKLSVCLALKHFTHNNFDFTGLARSLNEALQRRLRIAARPVRWRNPFELRFNRDASGTFTSRIRDREALRKHEPKLRSGLDIIKSGRLHLANIRVKNKFHRGLPSAPFSVSEIQSVRWEDIMDTRRNKVREKPAQLLQRDRRRNKSQLDVYLPRQLV